MADQALIPQQNMGRVQRNIERMMSAGAPQDEIQAYIQAEGMGTQEAAAATRPMPLGEHLYDAAVSAPVGAAEAAIGIAGLPGQAQQLARQGMTAMTGQKPPEAVTAELQLPTGADIQKKVESWTGPFYQSRTPEGQGMRLLGQNAVGAVAPGSATRRILGGVVGPALGSELAGELTKGSPYETPARIAGGVGGGMGGSVATTGINAIRGGANARGMPVGASRVLSKTLTPDAEARLGKFGPEAFLAEATPGTFGAAQGVATRPGAGQAALVNAYDARNAGTNARLASELDRNVGFASVPSDIERTISNTRAAIGTQYDQALRSAPPVDVRPIVQRLDGMIASEAGAPRKVLEEIKGYLQSNGQLKSSAAELHNVREAIDDLIKKNADQPTAVRVASIFRREIDSQMSPQVKALDAKIQELARQQEALNLGGQVLGTGKEALRPQELAEIIASGMDKKAPMSAGQQSALRIGTRAELDRVVGTSANDAAALKRVVQSEGDWNRAKLAQVFGQSEADGILRSIDKEAAFQRAYTKMIENSQTAQRTGGQKLVEQEATRAPAKSDMTVLGAGVAATRATYNKIADLLRSGSQAKADDALGKLLATTGPQRDEIIRNIRAAQSFQARHGTAGRDELIRALLAGGSASLQ